MRNQFMEYGIFAILIAAGIFGLIISNGHPFGEYAALYIIKPALKMMMVMLIAQFSFRKVDFQVELLKGNIAVAICFAGICLVIVEAL